MKGLEGQICNCVLAGAKDNNLYFTFHRDLAKFFLSCSDTVPWIFLLLAALPEILKGSAKKIRILWTVKKERIKW